MVKPLSLEDVGVDSCELARVNQQHIVAIYKQLEYAPNMIADLLVRLEKIMNRIDRLQDKLEALKE